MRAEVLSGLAQGQERFRLELIATRERQEKVLKRRYRGHRLDDGVEDFEEWKRFDEIRSCFFNSDGTGIAQQEGVSDLGSIETRIKQLSPTDDDLEKMTPERFKRIVAQCVTISTTHKIKGAEFPRVFVLESTFGYTRTGLQPRRKQKPKAAIEEKNLWYVAITRVKGERGNIERGIMPREGELYYVNDIESLVRGKTVKDLQEVMK
jgi:superfamily I DNA/RNA helicase